MNHPVDMTAFTPDVMTSAGLSQKFSAGPFILQLARSSFFGLDMAPLLQLCLIHLIKRRGKQSVDQQNQMTEKP